MKILVLNGSPRLNGNTRTALNEIIAGIKANVAGADLELIDVTEQSLSGCTNCDACKSNGGICITPDDSAEIIQKIVDADVVVFGTPVYFWGITAQLKMVIDKLYSKDDQIREQAPPKKKIGLVAIGGADLTDREYGLISEQFGCICDYLGWNLCFSQPISALDAGEIANDKAKMKELGDLWRYTV